MAINGQTRAIFSLSNKIQ